MHFIIKKIKEKLLASVDEKSKETFQRFFKNKVRFYGVRTPSVKKIAKECFKELNSKQKAKVFLLCEELSQSGFCEEVWIAATWADWLKDSFLQEDISTFERWIETYIDDWAKCDTFCNHAVGTMLMMYPELVWSLKKWASSKNPFLRRAAAVSLIIPAKKGMFLKDIFEVAGILLFDQNDLDQKGYGWMLKEVSRKHQKAVFDYVMKNKTHMPRTALRYAIEKMPETLRKKAMGKEKKPVKRNAS
jgi:3-methyladenine DNA glycosylase AlkD